MSKNIILVLLALVLVSCHKKLAFFQPSKSPNYHSEKIPSLSQNFPETEFYSDNTLPESIASSEDSPEFFLNQNTAIQNINETTINTSPLEEITAKKPSMGKSKFSVLKNNDSENFIKRKKLYPAFNDNLKIGFVFLVIAAILALFHLNQLVLIFGLASLVFLYLGLKKYYRRKRIKSIFRK